MAWEEMNDLGNTITPNWADETRAAIAVHDGIAVTVAGGITVTFATAFIGIDNYAVKTFWQEDPGLRSGELFPIKSLASCLLKITGDEYGKKFYYRIVPVKDL